MPVSCRTPLPPHVTLLVHPVLTLGYINIRRGGYVAAIVGICMNPWLLFKSSATFSNYLGSYGVLLSCIAGPMITDYYLVRRGHYRINDLYTTDKSGWYWYTAGINWRGYLGYVW
jgi:NCS1 family nucleobase:cation symporter-1